MTMIIVALADASGMGAFATARAAASMVTPARTHKAPSAASTGAQ